MTAYWPGGVRWRPAKRPGQVAARNVELPRDGRPATLGPVLKGEQPADHVDRSEPGPGPGPGLPPCKPKSRPPQHAGHTGARGICKCRGLPKNQLPSPGHCIRQSAWLQDASTISKQRLCRMRGEGRM
eukprot:gene18820-biopygen14507